MLFLRPIVLLLSLLTVTACKSGGSESGTKDLSDDTQSRDGSVTGQIFYYANNFFYSSVCPNNIQPTSVSGGNYESLCNLNMKAIPESLFPTLLKGHYRTVYPNEAWTATHDAAVDVITTMMRNPNYTKNIDDADNSPFTAKVAAVISRVFANAGQPVPSGSSSNTNPPSPFDTNIMTQNAYGATWVAFANTKGKFNQLQVLVGQGCTFAVTEVRMLWQNGARVEGTNLGRGIYSFANSTYTAPDWIELGLVGQAGAACFVRFHIP